MQDRFVHIMSFSIDSDSYTPARNSYLPFLFLKINSVKTYLYQYWSVIISN